MKILIKGGRIIDPASGRDEIGDVFVADGKISGTKEKTDRTIDAKGLVVAPGLIDLSARLREPGYEYKATLESEMDAAVLARGLAVEVAVAQAQEYTWNALAAGFSPGHGQSIPDRFPGSR